MKRELTSHWPTQIFWHASHYEFPIISTHNSCESSKFLDPEGSLNATTVVVVVVVDGDEVVVVTVFEKCLRLY